jgi:hypothetical protein
MPNKNDVHYISEEVLNRLDRQIKTYQSEYSFNSEDEGRQCQVESEWYLIYSCLFLSTIEVNNGVTL